MNPLLSPLIHKCSFHLLTHTYKCSVLYLLLFRVSSFIYFPSIAINQGQIRSLWLDSIIFLWPTSHTLGKIVEVQIHLIHTCGSYYRNFPLDTFLGKINDLRSYEHKLNQIEYRQGTILQIPLARILSPHGFLWSISRLHIFINYYFNIITIIMGLLIYFYLLSHTNIINTISYNYNICGESKEKVLHSRFYISSTISS